MKEYAEKLRSILGPMLDIQSNVSCSILLQEEYMHLIDVSWFDGSGMLLAYIRITDLVNNPQFACLVSRFKLVDIYDMRLHEILKMNSDYVDEFWYNFQSFEQVEKALTVFTCYLINELN